MGESYQEIETLAGDQPIKRDFVGNFVEDCFIVAVFVGILLMK